MRVGICGFHGSGKTTVFHALAPAGRNGRNGKNGVALGNIKVPDERVDRLAALFHPKKTTYAEITFVDVGSGDASKGAFPPMVLENMRTMDVLVHVVRAFDSALVVEEADPERDVSRFDDEMVLLDLDVLERRADRWRREGRRDHAVEVNDRCLAHLEGGSPLRTLALAEDERATLQGLQLLSAKPLITLYNLSEEAWEDDGLVHLRELREPAPDTVSLGMCGVIEAEIAEMDAEDQAEILEGLGLGEPARIPFIHAAYRLLDLISFLTSGEDECRAWPVRRGSSAQRAAGRIHSDLERGFIRAEVHSLEDLEAAGTEAKLKKLGKIRVEGKAYEVQDGDVMHIRFNV